MTAVAYLHAPEHGHAAGWIAPLRAGLPEVTDLDFQRLHLFDGFLIDLLTAHPVDAGVGSETRSKRLLLVREELARGGHLATAVATRDGGCGRPSLIQTLMQFICGYHDIDLRDSTGLGHGRLIARHASSPVRDRWLPRLLAGALPGIAITERCGGSRPRATATQATVCRGGAWAINGTKTWISRLNEAAVFCVFFTDPAGRLSAGVIDAAAQGLTRRPIQPSGLSGWAWGELHLEDVRVRPCDLLGPPGSGIALLREHFAHYRPLVAATALGAAAAACDTVAAHLIARRAAGVISEVRDNALITLGRAYAQINAALLATLTAQRLSAAGDTRAELWGCTVKAYGVDVAYTTVSELTLLVGALGFTADSALAKARRDLNGLLYADGIHDSLYRSAGRTLTTTARPDSGLAELPGPGTMAMAGLTARPA
ncbi:acyl-CoA dehydrogenase family protein [Nonomuraea sp. NPDC048901]|uniref:acyl-CoA dehydrogenase family protein n=1 Tax=Nonomuraea sp. NPDC048901 TaxID=3155627 RepID=UPI0033F5EF5F